MTYLEELIEAVSYAQENGMDWWDIFDSIEDAEDILHAASREEPDEYQVAHLVSLIEDDDIFIDTPIGAFKGCIKKLKRQLKRA